MHLRDGLDDGVTGVIAAVATLVTGAAENGGIGVEQLHKRHGLLYFEASIDGTIEFRRRDTRADVGMNIYTNYVPHDLKVFELMPHLTKKLASVGSRHKLREL